MSVPLEEMDERALKALARRAALLEGFVAGAVAASGDECWLETHLDYRPFRGFFIEALHDRIFELESQLRDDQIEAAKKAVLFSE